MNANDNKAMPCVAAAGHCSAGSEQNPDRARNALMNTPDGHAASLSGVVNTV